MVIGSSDAKFGDPLKFLMIYYRQQDLALGVFFRNIRMSKMKMFVNFALHIHFQVICYKN